MTPEFQKHLDPLIGALIDLAERSDRMSPEELKVELTREFDCAHNALETNSEWMYAKYALVAWIDAEIILNHKIWKDDPLEAHYFRMGNAYTEFFLRAKKAYEKRYFDAYEVYYICFMLGYHGIYQLADRSSVPASLPNTDVEWQSQTARRIAKIKKQPAKPWVETIDIDAQDGALEGYTSLINNLVFFGFAIFLLLLIVLIKSKLAG